jgi:SAM-dependent methyltransferase
MFPGDPVRAASEVRRVLKPAATAAFLVHGPHHEQTVYAVVHDTALRFFGLRGDPAESLRYRFQERGTLDALLRAAGYRSVAEEELRDSVQVTPGTRFWKSALDRAFGHHIDRLDDAGRARLEAEILKGFEPYRSGEGYRVGLLMRLGTGQA